MSSARKPYHNLKKSIVAFYRGRISFMKTLVQKFSEFEKPYVDESYPEMHLQIPLPNWPRYQDPWVPGVWGFPLPDPPVIQPEPGPGSQWSAPPDSDIVFRSEGCILYDVPLEVYPDDIFSGWFSGAYDSTKPMPFEKPVHFEVTGPATIAPSGTFGFTLHIDSGAQDGEIVEYTAHGEWGSICTGACVVIADCDCTELGAYIDYTTDQMAGGESQTIYGKPSRQWDWTVVTGENTYNSTGKSVMVFAPTEDNEDCNNNIEISMACPGEDGEVCDTLTIAVTTAECEDYSSSALWSCCDHVWGGDQGLCCFLAYDCMGVMILDADNVCCPWLHLPEACGVVVGCELGSDQCANSVNCSGTPPGCSFETNDTRSAAMKTAGCCPRILI